MNTKVSDLAGQDKDLPAVQQEGREPSEEAVAAAAGILAKAPTIEPSGLAVECWHGTAREVLIAAIPFLSPAPASPRDDHERDTP